MRFRPGGIVAALVVVALALTGCTDTPARGGGRLERPRHGGADRRQRRRSGDAVRGRRRIGSTSRRRPITELAWAARRGPTIPYAAVLYDPTGDTWAYTNPEPLVFVRAPIDRDPIDGSRARPVRRSRGRHRGRDRGRGRAARHRVRGRRGVSAGARDRPCCAGSSRSSLQFRYLVVALAPPR